MMPQDSGRDERVPKEVRGGRVQENEIIGIVGVLVLTSCLIALYHLIGKIGRHNSRYGAQTKRANNPEEDRQSDHDPHRNSGKDDAWLLWSPELDERAGQSKPGSPGYRETRSSWDALAK